LSAAGKGSTAVRAAKRPRLSDGEDWQKLELFPTPPWATRALVEHVLPRLEVGWLDRVWDPCAGLGHMSEVLAETAREVVASDFQLYVAANGEQPVTRSVNFLVRRAVLELGFWGGVDWIITNPPFGQAHVMLDRAFDSAHAGVAFLCRLQWLEGAERYEAIFRDRPPTLLAPFAERVAMTEGGWDPAAATATAYAWFVWLIEDGFPVPPFGRHAGRPGELRTLLIPPGRKRALTRESDKRLAARFMPGFTPPSTLRRAGPAQGALLRELSE
jgi:hypothetical protein